jgi:hypothetical protein
VGEKGGAWSLPAQIIGVDLNLADGTLSAHQRHLN